MLEVKGVMMKGSTGFKFDLGNAGLWCESHSDKELVAITTASHDSSACLLSNDEDV